MLSAVTRHLQPSLSFEWSVLSVSASAPRATFSLSSLLEAAKFPPLLGQTQGRVVRLGERLLIQLMLSL